MGFEQTVYRLVEKNNVTAEEMLAVLAEALARYEMARRVHRTPDGLAKNPSIFYHLSEMLRAANEEKEAIADRFYNDEPGGNSHDACRAEQESMAIETLLDLMAKALIQEEKKAARQIKKKPRSPQPGHPIMRLAV